MAELGPRAILNYLQKIDVDDSVIFTILNMDTIDIVSANGYTHKNNRFLTLVFIYGYSTYLPLCT